MSLQVRLQHPEWLHPKVEGIRVYGYNQEWYGTDWQRLAGCGPTTATQLMCYLGFRDGWLEPSEFDSQEEIVPLMEAMWPYVQPRRGGGLFKTRWLAEGLQAYVAEKEHPYQVEMMRVFPFRVQRPSLQEVFEFVGAGLKSDCPIAFLNRHRGKEMGLETWHWVPIVGLEEAGNDYIGTVYDEGMEKTFSLQGWLHSTVLGGGFVYAKR